MIGGMFRERPWNRFDEFIAPSANRFGILCSILAGNGLEYRVLELAGRRHIAAGNAAAPSLLFAAHYDRAANSSGANDNSAAVFMLIQAALERAAAPDSGGAKAGPVFVFTDKEELSGGEGVSDQGAYSLALYLRRGAGRVSAAPPRVYCFDACGAGDTLIVSTAADHLLKNENSPAAEALRRRVRELRAAALEAARETRAEKILLLPTPFSDDAGFLKAGLAAQTVTVLPGAEAAAFASLARARSGTDAAAPSADRRFVPETWRSLNGPGDSPLRLTPQYWKNVVRFALALASTAG